MGRLVGGLWRAAKVALAAAFVVWQLSVILYRNVADLWPAKVEAATAELADDCPARSALAWFDDASLRYCRLTATGQGWCMFSSPLAREGAFPAVHLVWDDDSVTAIRSDNEPDDVTKFFRVGDCRQRKLEDYLVRSSADSGDEEADLYKNYVFWRFKIWRARHPDDRREPKELRLVRRNHTYLDWANGTTEYAAVVETAVAAYGPGGELRP